MIKEIVLMSFAVVLIGCNQKPTPMDKIKTTYQNNSANDQLTNYLQILTIEIKRKLIEEQLQSNPNAQKMLDDLPPPPKQSKDELLHNSKLLLLNALATDPDSPQVRLNFGIFNELAKQEDKALLEYQTAYQRAAPQSELAFFALCNMARIHGNKKEIDQALKYYQMALEIDPKSIEVKTNIELLFQGGGGGQGEGQDKNPNQDQDQNNSQSDKPDQDNKKQPPPRVDPRDVKQILEEIKKQEQRIREQMNKGKVKEESRDKDW